MKFCTALLALLLLAACGASGGLYLPDQAHPHNSNPLRKDRKADPQPGQPAPDDGNATPPPPSNNP